MVQLDPRKRTLLRTVVEEHIRSAEPVGSEHAAIREQLLVSPATIRSAMASLEGLGLLTHPHTSAGRVPTTQGYRVYVDMLLEADPLSVPARQAIRRRLSDPPEGASSVPDEAARLLAWVTGYPSVVSSPRLQAQTFRSLHLVRLDDRRALAVIVADSGTFQGRAIVLPAGVVPDDLEVLSRAITHRLQGCRVGDLTPQRLEQVLGEASQQHRWLEEVKAWLRRDLARGLRSRVRVEGTRHLLREPEFRSPDKATRVLEALEDEAVLVDVLAAAPEEGVWILIGEENLHAELHDCSMVMAAYRAGDRVGGTVGILGPTRMRYRSAVAAVRYVAERLTDAMRSSV